MLDVRAYFDAPTATVTYLAIDTTTHRAALIDPVLDYEPKAARVSSNGVDAIIAQARALGVTIEWVLETHAHADHLSGADYVRRLTGAKVAIGRHITDVQKMFKPLFRADDVRADGSAFDVLFDEGDTFRIGALEARVLHTPGHTPACVTYLIADAAFVGDTIFMPDFGTARTDFPGGDAATLYRSIRKILDLPGKTRIFVGHDYPPAERADAAWETSVDAQRAHNVHVRDSIAEAEFVAKRRARDATLAAPVLILPALQVNIRAGALPPAASDGRVYLTLPVNTLGAA
jgi:glyoxylase-like metal-dependent hydrolase (beta-lactamase superfamily II)